MHNELGVMIAMSNMLLPYVIFPVLGALLAIPPDLNTASASLGAHPARTFLRVTLPLTSAGTAAGALLTFIVGLGFYITPAMLGGAREMMISNLIAFNVREVLNWPLAFSLSTSLLASTIVLYLIYRALLPHSATLKPI
jgi:ABC-type spermidine/putrescine transport system permease subunit I